MDSLYTKPDSAQDKSENRIAFEMLFNRNYSNLVYFSFNIVKDKGEAEDIAQDAFVTYWNRKEEVAEDDNAIKSFLYTTVKNASLNLLRHQKVVEKFTLNLPELVDDKNIINSIIQSEVYSKIHHAIESLPPACQQIARMSYLDDKKNNEIAEELGISVNTVKTQKQRAMQLLRPQFTAEIFSVLLLIFLN
ncbi:RNA polymerase sigma-70 factor [Dyadobacter subterraneus]|uniref:RNA polymerase sigma-70 factor n=1 Tax=Dyadobacter subterraneus TaxID=2773304 RepID=A0ABR9WA31_9BACT|nr:RNA polymerase sigma-70 factor [Dyadobacter subterraneus]MBE9461241.1 RNA polymerase sigma-70 factor [Dyadobacter subterraneus]